MTISCRTALFLKLLRALLPTLLLSGCVESSTVVHLNRDGTGTIVTAEIVSAVARDVIKELRTGTNGPAAELMKLTVVNMDEIKQEARKFGEGITVVSARQIETSNGGLGREITYKFADINRLTFDQDSAEKTGEEEPIRFRYTPGKLQVLIPQDEGNDGNAMEKVAELNELPPRMRSLLHGMTIRIDLTFETDIKSTNSLYPLPEQKGITLVDLDLGKLANSPEAIKKFSSTRPSDRRAMQELMKSFPFIRMENQETVTIEF